MSNSPVEKPRKRSLLRKKLGKEYFILKRKTKWKFSKIQWAKSITEDSLPHEIFNHKSLLLRKLKNVDMYLQHNKVENLKIAIKNINGVIIKPGETFSLWLLVGRTSKRKGYKEGMTLSNGQVETGIGGGLCQLGNLMYWITLHSPLVVTERWRHSYDVFPDVNRKIPFGSGATLAYNYIDLQIKNTTEQNFQFNLWLDETHLNGKLNSDTELNKTYRVYEQEHTFKQQWWGGYTRHNKIMRDTELTNGEIESELITENHAVMMYTPFLEQTEK
jgi:vancomycin resistance protein VanW